MPSTERIKQHPVLNIPRRKELKFHFDGIEYTALKGEVISSALFANGVTIFGKHYLDESAQGIFCANGQCSQCMVIADGRAVKACMEPVREGMKVYSCQGLPKLPEDDEFTGKFKIITTQECDVLIVGGGPSGIAAAIELGKAGHSVVLIDDKSELGGKLVLQTHKFFGSIEDCYAGARGIDIADILKNELKPLDNVKVMLKTTAIGVYSDKTVGLLKDGGYSIIKPKKLLIAAGAREKALAFPGSDLPGIYGAGAFQTLLNRDLVKPSQRLFVIGGGNVGIIAGYHAIQADITVVGLAEALPQVSGYMVHADRIRRLGAPIYTSHSILRADGDEDGVKTVTIIEVDENFKNIPGTEKTFAVDTVLIAVGLNPISEMYELAQKCGIDVYAAGDAKEIAEASSAMFSGRIAGLEIARDLGDDVEIPEAWAEKAEILKSRPGPVIDIEYPEKTAGVFPVFHCTQEIPCNPCTTVCPKGGIVIENDSLMGLPKFQGECTGCAKCVAICPGLALTLVDFRKAEPGYAHVTAPFELILHHLNVGDVVPALDKEGKKVCDAEVIRITSPKSADRTVLFKVKVPADFASVIAGVQVQHGAGLEPLEEKAEPMENDDDVIICRCMRIKKGEVRELIRSGERDMNQLKAQLNIGMGACGARTCTQLIWKLFQEEGVPEEEVTPFISRPPDVEIPLGVFAAME